MKKSRKKADRPELTYLFAFWSGRLQEIACALDRARDAPLSDSVQHHVAEAYYAMNRAQTLLHEEERALLPLPPLRKGRR